MRARTRASATFLASRHARQKSQSPVPIPHSRSVVLDLGDVKHFAEVTINGKTFPVLWKPPFRVDITDAIGRAVSTKPPFSAASSMPPYQLDISIRVANLWANRLIGDDRQFADDCTWKGGVRNGAKEIGVKEIPMWVKEGGRSLRRDAVRSRLGSTGTRTTSFSRAESSAPSVCAS